MADDRIELVILSSESEIKQDGDLTIQIPLRNKTGLISIDGDINIFIQSGPKKQTISFDKGLQIRAASAAEIKLFESVKDVVKKNNSLNMTFTGLQDTNTFQIWGNIITKNGIVEDIGLKPFNVGNIALVNSAPIFEAAPQMDFTGLEVSAKAVISEVKEGAKTFFEDLNKFVKKDVQKVSLVEPNRTTTLDQYIWMYIRNGVIDFEHYKSFIDAVMCDDSILRDDTKIVIQNKKKDWSKQLPFLRTDAFGILKFATDFYMQEYFKISKIEDPIFDNTLIKKGAYEVDGFEDEAQRTKINPDEIEGFIHQKKVSSRNYWLNGTDYLPYFETVMTRIPFDFKENLGKIACEDDFPDDFMADTNLLELIWSYWHEEGGLVQTMNAISLRFQNVRAGSNDPLAGLNIDPLRPINNLVWGYIEDERNRLSMARRNLEYQYEYGISLIGKAVANIQVAESRSQFLPGFHNLLKTAIDFYQQANYTTVIPDGFPVLNSLREVHLLLSEGAHNQFGSLPWTARAEMLMQQWLLARPEMREFLGGRIMMPYNEPWMDRVDTMKTIQGWNPTNITHFHDLGAFGEQLLLSIRYGSWNDPSQTRDNAANWAYYWREEIQRYVHAYKAATGVDLGNDVTDARIAMPQNVERYTQPSVLIGRRVNSLPNNRPNQLNRLTQRRNIERY